MIGARALNFSSVCPIYAQDEYHVNGECQSYLMVESSPLRKLELIQIPVSSLLVW